MAIPNSNIQSYDIGFFNSGGPVDANTIFSTLNEAKLAFPPNGTNAWDPKTRYVGQKFMVQDDGTGKPGEFWWPGPGLSDEDLKPYKVEAERGAGDTLNASDKEYGLITDPTKFPYLPWSIQTAPPPDDPTGEPVEQAVPDKNRKLTINEYADRQPGNTIHSRSWFNRMIDAVKNFEGGNNMRIFDGVYYVQDDQ